VNCITQIQIPNLYILPSPSIQFPHNRSVVPPECQGSPRCNTLKKRCAMLMLYHYF